MPTLKDLRTRINSVTSTKKITSAMRMISVAKLRKAQESNNYSRQYEQKITNLISHFLSQPSTSTICSPFLKSEIKNTKNNHLVIFITSGRGLCGGFNGSVIRKLDAVVNELHHKNHNVRILPLGNKFSAIPSHLKKLLTQSRFVHEEPDVQVAKVVTQYIYDKLVDDQIDSCSIIYNYFHSVLSQEIITDNLFPISRQDYQNQNKKLDKNSAFYICEPSIEQLMHQLFLQNLEMKIYRAMIESYTSEQGARMTAMDGATRNANDLINDLSMRYNKMRQTIITSELIEIISGAEAS